MNHQIRPSQAEQRLISDNLEADVRQTALRLKTADDVRPSYVVQQIRGRQMARKKIPSWSEVEGLVFPQHLSMEQCSSEAAARYKAELVEGATLVDLTGGLGVDFSFMARKFKTAVHVERDEELSAIAEHNMPLLGLPEARVVCADGVQYLSEMQCDPATTTIFLDPARRDPNGRKTVMIADCTPDVTQLEERLMRAAATVVVKLSPMLDASDALLRLRQHVARLHVVAVQGECKELLIVMHRKPESLTITAVNIAGEARQVFTFSPQEEQDAQVDYAEAPLDYLYEPNAALMKAGAFRSVASRFGLSKLQQNSHLYTSRELVDSFPGRTFAIDGFAPLSKNIRKTLLANIDAANIAVRNFPLSVDDLRKKLKLRDGGNVYLFATTLTNNRHVIIRCSKPNNP